LEEAVAVREVVPATRGAAEARVVGVVREEVMVMVAGWEEVQEVGMEKEVVKEVQLVGLVMAGVRGGWVEWVV
jgi:hypothetical protein